MPTDTTDDVLPPLDVATDEADEHEQHEYAEIERFVWTHIGTPFDDEIPF